MPKAITLALLAVGLTGRLLAGPAAAFVIQSAVVHTGVPFNLTVRAVDLAGNTDTSYAGTVHFSSSDPAAVLPADYSFTGADAGAHTFSATLHGDNVNQSITATDNSSVSGTGNFAVRDPAIVVWFTAELPYFSTREAQTPFVVTAKNSDGDAVAGYRGTVTFSASLRGPDPSVEVPPDYTFTASDAGTHTFYVVFHRGGQHQVWVTDVATGASGSDDTSVQCSDITLTAINSGPVCPGSAVTLTALTNAQDPSFIWYPQGGGGLVLHGQSVTTTIGGMWWVTMDDSVSGCSATTNTVVAYEPPPSISAPSQASGDFSASIASDPNGPYTDIVWTITAGGSVVAGQGTATATIRPNPSAQTVAFTVEATRVSTSCRHSNDASVEIVAAPPSAAIATGGSVCPHANGVASVPDAGAGATYAWSLTNASLVSGQGTPSIVFAAPASGTVSISATVTRGGASAAGTASVAVGGPSAMLRSTSAPAGVCAGGSAILDVALTGTPPFTLVWSDGMTQSGIMSNAASRQVSPAETAVYSIVGVSDAVCSGEAGGAVQIDVLGAPLIAQSPQNAAVPANSSARLTVDAPGDRLMFQWFEGSRGDVSKPVGGNAAAFTTPPVTHATAYWVRVSNACGSTDSAAAVVAPARVRAARH
jgi:Ig-like domain CHU_C associated/PKD-like domain